MKQILKNETNEFNLLKKIVHMYVNKIKYMYNLQMSTNMYVNVHTYCKIKNKRATLLAFMSA